MNLFIDTNTYLSFFHFTDDDLGELEKLVPVIDHKKVTLWATDQLLNEFERNRDAKIRDALKDFSGPKLPSRPPVFLKDYEEFATVTDKLKEANKAYSALENKIRADIEGRNLAADKLVRKIWAVARRIEHSQELYGKALERM